MRIVAFAFAVVMAAVLAWACAGATAQTGNGPTAAATTARSSQILLEEGGLMRPIENGGRVPLRSGWATVRFSEMPIRHGCDLHVTLFDATGAKVAGEVSARYESLDMDHGRAIARSSVDAGVHRMRLAFEMPGQWKVTLTVGRGGPQETITLVLPNVGL